MTKTESVNWLGCTSIYSY